MLSTIVYTYFCCCGKGAENELKDAVGLVRPVSVAFEVINGFRLYKSGVYTSDHCGTTPMVSYNILVSSTYVNI